MSARRLPRDLCANPLCMASIYPNQSGSIELVQAQVTETGTYHDRWRLCGSRCARTFLDLSALKNRVEYLKGCGLGPEFQVHEGES